MPRLSADAQKMEDAVLALVAREGYTALTFRELRHTLNCPRHLVGELMDTVESLVNRGRLAYGHRDTILPGKAPKSLPLPRTGKDWKQTEEGPDWPHTKELFEKSQELPGPFSNAIIGRIRKLSEPGETEFKDREDCRQDTVYTIDPKDARDHDDAVCVRTLPGGRRWQLDVHIADVSHYVDEGSPLDKEALKRSFTNYLPWRAVPMLPEELSTDLCSLLDGHDRLALSCRMTVNSKGQILSYRFCESVVNVHRFLTYEEAQELGDRGDPAMKRLAACAAALKAAREKENLLSFNVPEAQIQFDRNGEPCGAVPATHLPSHSWIEECMLAANRCCAHMLDENGLSGLYRVHEPPEPETIAAIASWAASLGESLPRPPSLDGGNDLNVRPELQSWLADLLKVEGLPLGLQAKIIRCMKKARYSTECLGHFALGWRHYSHYTSPIRRYADLWTHRVLKAFLRHQAPGATWDAASRRIASHISAREEAVMKTERAGVKSCIAWTLRNRAGDQFDAVITGVEPIGVFVQLKDPWAEGMIHVRNLQSDFFEHNADRMELVGMRTHRTLRMGDELRVTLLKADPLMGFIDFALADDEGALERFQARDARRQQRRAKMDGGGRRGRRSDIAREREAHPGQRPRRSRKDRR